MKVRDRLIRLLGGVERELYLYERDARNESRDALRDVHRSYDRDRIKHRQKMLRLEEKLEGLGLRVKRGEPVACPECGSMELQDVYDKVEKKAVRCIPCGHQSTWGESGVLFEHEQRYRQKIKDEERRDRLKSQRAMDELVRENRGLQAEVDQLKLELEEAERCLSCGGELMCLACRETVPRPLERAVRNLLAGQQDGPRASGQVDRHTVCFSDLLVDNLRSALREERT